MLRQVRLSKRRARTQPCTQMFRRRILAPSVLCHGSETCIHDTLSARARLRSRRRVGASPDCSHRYGKCAPGVLSLKHTERAYLGHILGAQCKVPNGTTVPSRPFVLLASWESVNSSVNLCVPAAAARPLQSTSFCHSTNLDVMLLLCGASRAPPVREQVWFDAGHTPCH